MICPNCGGDTENIKLQDTHRENFDINRCLHCGGIWLDRGKLDRIPDERIEEVDVHVDLEETDDIFGLNCPRCYMPLEEFHHPRLGKMTFLRCPDCHGFWLRRGQLFQYARAKRHDNEPQTDAFGTLTRRDRMLVTFSSIILMLIIGGLLFSTRFGNLPLSADILRREADTYRFTWIFLLIVDLVIFGTGLIFALFRRHMLTRLSGWMMVLFSIFILIYLAKA